MEKEAAVSQPAASASEPAIDADKRVTNSEKASISEKSNVPASSDTSSEDSEEREAEIQEEGLHRAITNLADGIVGWDGEDDPQNPINWPNRKKWLVMFLVSSITFVSPLASSMVAPGISFTAEELHESSTTLASLAVSIFILGYVVGTLILAPLSEIYGRKPVLDVANFIFAVFQIGCALAPTFPALIVFRLLAGIGGSGCLTIGGGVIGDLFKAEKRAKAMAIYTIGPLIGPVIGPICGGFIAQQAGWRWVYWVLLIAGATISTILFFVNRETYPEVILQRKVVRMREEKNMPELISWYEKDRPRRTKGQILSHGLVRPLKMLAFSPITFFLALYMSVAYGLLYLLFTTVTGVFVESYGWSVEIAGLAYLGIGLGFMVGLLIVGATNDKSIKKLAKANNNVFEPEMRMASCLMFACLMPISFFWYGWTVEKHVHWIVPIIGLFPFGVGMMGIFLPIQTYMVDAFTLHAASATAALASMRSLFGAFLPLAGPSMYKSLGYGWGNSLLGFIALALIPVPAIIYKYGGTIRKRYPVKL